MNAYPYLNPWLQCLLQLAPPRGLLHIGAGGGSARQYPFVNMPSVLAVEADAQQTARLQAQLLGHDHCQVLQAVVAAEAGSADFYSLSQSNESGLCPPEALQPLWPNIKALRADAVETTTLHRLLSQAPQGAAGYNWLVIDCLPASELLHGAGDLLNGCDVLLARALKEAPAGASPSVQAMCLPALRQQLAAFGLEFVAMEEENHPQLVRALFVRNPSQQLTLVQLEARTQIEQLTQEKTKLIADNAELSRARDELAAQRAAEAQAKSEAITLRDLEAQAKNVALQQRDALAVNQATLTAARDEQADLATERQATLTALQTQRDSLAQEKSKLIADSADLARARDQLVSQKEAEAKARAEAIAQRDAETKAKTEAAAQRDAEAKAKSEAIAQRDALAKEKAALTAARDEQAKLATERQTALATQQQATASKQQRLQQLDADNQEFAARQSMLQEELIKAEAQIDLIKDLLLREPGL